MANTKANKSKKKSGKKAAASRARTRSVSVKKSSTKNSRTRTSAVKSTKKPLDKNHGDTVALRQQEGIPMSDEIGLVLSFGLMILMMFSNFGLCGTLGMWLSSFFFGIFGLAQYVMPVAYFAGMTILLANDYSNLAMKKCAAAFAMLMTISGFAQLVYPDPNVAISEVFSLSVNHRECGGIIGGGLALTLKSGFGTVGAAVILVCIFLLSAILLTQKSLAGFYKNLVDWFNRFRADQKVKRAQRSEERKQWRAEEAALERERLILAQAQAAQEAAVEEVDEEEDEDYGQEPRRRPPEKKRKKGFLSRLRRSMSPGRKRSTSSIDDKVKELEKRKKMQNTSAFHFDSKEISRKKTGTNSPVFTSTERLLRKDSVRELHPQAYPFTEEDGKTQPFDGELDYSAFARHEGSGLDDYIERNRKNQTGKEAASPGGLTQEIRIHNMYDEDSSPEREDLTQAEAPKELTSGTEVRPRLDEADQGLKVTEIPMEAVARPDETGQGLELTGAVMEAETQPDEAGRSLKPAEINREEGLFQTQEKAEENSFSFMDAVTEEPGALSPDQLLQQAGESSQEGKTFAASRTSAAAQPAPAKAAPAKAAPAKTVPAKTASAQAGPEADIRINRAVEPRALSEKKGPAREQKKKTYVYPPVNLLVREEQSFPADHDRILKETAIKLQDTLKSFGVNVTITDISCGPTVTRYEMFPEQGTKVSKIVSLTDDIKLNLAAADIRIEAPIPGKSAIGIEVPNKHNQIVHFRNLIDNRTFKKFKSRLAFAVGKDIGGKIVVTDLAKMPHLLIAGATGSGKSVCINTLIMSLIYKASPEEVRMIMVDPKMVELSVYNGIPHLLIPVVTDPKKAAGALNWAVTEMTERYRKFSETGVRNIEGYNKKVTDLIASGKAVEGDLKKMPQIVIIIDELADLMMVSPGEVEDAIVRLSQLARAAGIHLVIATQRPSVNVITGLIKANVPSRIAFAVSSGVDSRTILDMNGAEKLLGKGDMLFYPAGLQKPVRVQGAFISDEEINSVVDFIKDKAGDTEYDSSVSEKIEKKIQSGNVSQDRDEYFEAAARFIMEKDKATIGMLQRMFKIGFNRAARIIDQLAEAGIIGPEEGTKPRKILMSPEQLDQYFEEYL